MRQNCQGNTRVQPRHTANAVEALCRCGYEFAAVGPDDDKSALELALAATSLPPFITNMSAGTGTPWIPSCFKTILGRGWDAGVQ